MHSSKVRNIKLLLEYDGTDFVGWQFQPRGRSIQGELERSLKQLLQEEVDVVGAGRTDAGVHARGQVANFRTATERSIVEIQRALDAMLPEDIVVRSVEEVHFDFHARYSAKERRYKYFITTDKHALDRQHTWYVSYSLDLQGMSRAAELIQGEHDFEAFSKTDSGVDDYMCNVRSAQWTSEDPVFAFEISADHFVRGMVRALVGTMVDVGRGHLTADAFKEILSKKNRAEAGMAAPAKGLFLEEVRY